MSTKLPSFKNSNIAMIGSSEDLEQRVKAARGEKAWANAGKKVGVQIWRIEKMKIKAWPREKYGTFFGGDCYIVLHTYKKGDAIRWNVHFWLGLECTQDEKGVAAYKTVELDDLLGCLPVQYREVQGFESGKFMKLFKNEITIMKGGIDSGFNHVKPKEYKPRLFHIKGKRRVQVMECDLKATSLNIGDAFVLDNGLEVFTWLPSKSGATEKYRANRVADKLKGSRKGCKKIALGEEGDDAFWKLLGGKEGVKKETEVPLDTVFDKIKSTYKKQLWKLSDESGKMKFAKKTEGKKFLHKDLDPMDVFIIDSGSKIIAWIGKKASKNERSKAIMFAQSYLVMNKRPIYLPITRVMDGDETTGFKKLFKAWPKKKKK